MSSSMTKISLRYGQCYLDPERAAADLWGGVFRHREGSERADRPGGSGEAEVFNVSISRD